MPTQTFVKNRKQELRKIGDRRDVIEGGKVRFVNTVLGKKTSNEKIAFFYRSSTQSARDSHTLIK